MRTSQILSLHFLSKKDFKLHILLKPININCLSMPHCCPATSDTTAVNSWCQVFPCPWRQSWDSDPDISTSKACTFNYSVHIHAQRTSKLEGQVPEDCAFSLLPSCLRRPTGSFDAIEWLELGARLVLTLQWSHHWRLWAKDKTAMGETRNRIREGQQIYREELDWGKGVSMTCIFWCLI